MFANVDGATPEHWATVQANMGLVVYFVNRMRIPEQRRDDAISDGMFGLLRAAQKYDPTRGFKFSTYAESWIRQSIQRGRYYLGDTNRLGDEHDTLSLHHVYGDDQDLLDVLPANDDPALSAEAMLLLEDAANECDDDLDRDVLAALIAGHPTSNVGPHHGVSGQTARFRGKKLARRVANRNHLAA